MNRNVFGLDGFELEAANGVVKSKHCTSGYVSYMVESIDSLNIRQSSYLDCNKDVIIQIQCG